ncbi:NAD(P)-dependent oxidoreductase [Actinoplanes sp. Pm04-4]|uniref:NAD(P)-dependent oxidoreductase n=1 Tax=Paractinoplanes pyxinae TaxID=2997416 RepID=A0ABT4AZS7_9ACTN|nr:NAD(P)-dependent oxidoreductase [Actinoplanes pyxinae]MCY1139746.1 NAD(P)-dependent oxidoreductase [Actinoplanes pyxinae]
MARIAVTGGSGKLGRAVVKDLLDHGQQVVNLDAAASDGSYVKVDLTDFGQVVGALTAVDDRYDGIDAVVHLAAIPAPGLRPNAAIFHNNVPATYNVFEAARVAGIKTVVWASSETVLGLPFESTPPPYLPADENYEARPNSAYSLGKHLEEQMAAQFCRWDPELTMIGLRFSNVMEPHDYEAFPSYDADPHLRSWNAWGYIDARDGAQAVRKALTYREPGVEIFVIANADTVMSRPSAALAAEVFPDLPITKELGEHETLLSIDKARRLLGYEPEFSWRTKA